MARHGRPTSQPTGDDDLQPDTSLRRQGKVRPEKGSSRGPQRDMDEEPNGGKSSSHTPSQGSAEDRRTRLSRSTKETVYKNPPWAGDMRKPNSSHQEGSAGSKKGTHGPGQQGRGGGSNGAHPTAGRKALNDDSPMEVDDPEQGPPKSKRKRKRKRAGSATTIGGGNAEEVQHQEPRRSSPKPVKKKAKITTDKPASDLHAQSAASAPAMSGYPARRTYAAAKIDENAPSSDSEEEAPLRPPRNGGQARAGVLPPKFARKQSVPTMPRSEDGGESPDDDGHGEEARQDEEAQDSGEDVEEREAHDAPIDFAAEAVTFSNNTPTRTSQQVPPQNEQNEPPHDSEDEDHDQPFVKRGHCAPGHVHPRNKDCGEESEKEALPASGDVKHKQSHRERKLEQEMPVLSAPKKSKSKQKARHNDSDDDGEDLPWFAHTDITDALVPTSKTSWTISLTLLNGTMAQVVREALRLGAIALEIGKPDMTLETMNKYMPYTPFQPKGLNQYGMDALINVSENLGFGSRYDVAHRLEAGSMLKYILPSSGYVGGRLRSYRGSVKTAALQVVPGALLVPDGPDRTRDRTPEELKTLLTDVNFLFPMNYSTGDFDTSRPFSGPGIKEIIKAAFFVDKQWYNVGLSNLRLFQATENFPSDEPEVTPVMLALAATALEATLRDMTNAGELDFAGNLYHESFMDHLETALDFRKKKPSNYHTLTHELLVYASNGRVRSGARTMVSGGKRRARINWDAIQEPDA
ncbi:hypothetical protein C8T65DRAFT_703385 [Cerioporus squamosus]|nr:hypothetical protein C8T65DRAFT_703385 [Cerioporus squamosus]